MPVSRAARTVYIFPASFYTAYDFPYTVDRLRFFPFPQILICPFPPARTRLAFSDPPGAFQRLPIYPSISSSQVVILRFELTEDFRFAQTNEEIISFEMISSHAPAGARTPESNLRFALIIKSAAPIWCPGFEL